MGCSYPKGLSFEMLWEPVIYLAMGWTSPFSLGARSLHGHISFSL